MSPIDRNWLSNLDRYVLRQLSAGIPLQTADLAIHSHLSERQFFRRLKKVSGLTPRQYLQQHRLRYARRMLDSRKKNWTYAEVARQVGYQRGAYLKKLLLEEEGV